MGSRVRSKAVLYPVQLKALLEYKAVVSGKIVQKLFSFSVTYQRNEFQSFGYVEVEKPSG